MFPFIVRSTHPHVPMHFSCGMIVCSSSEYWLDPSWLAHELRDVIQSSRETESAREVCDTKNAPILFVLDDVDDLWLVLSRHVMTR